MKTATSVKAQIKYRANKENRDVQDMFVLYVFCFATTMIISYV